MEANYIEISSYEGEGYTPMIDYNTWRVAILRYCDELLVENIKTMQKHNETDEVFVLLEGNCTLFVSGDRDRVGEITAYRMEPLKLYNIKKGVWHTHTLDKNATVLIIENKDTSAINSPTILLTDEQRAYLKSL